MARSKLNEEQPRTPEQTIAALFRDAADLIQTNTPYYLDRLSEAVSIPSVSADLTYRHHCFKMADMLHDCITELGGVSEKVLVGFQQLETGERHDLPPVILADFQSSDRNKPTLLVYGHYDVQPASEHDGWKSPPFEMTERDGNLYGRGTTDDKGPILAWLWAIQLYRHLQIELPINIKFCLEGMEESNSECLEELLEREVKRGGFLNNIDYVVVSDNYWTTPSKPCLTYGLRGLATFQCEVRGPSTALHSGVFGGALTEPMTDVVQLLAAVSSAGHGEIGVDNCGKSSALPVTDDEMELYSGISFDLDSFKEDAGDVKTLVGDSKTDVLMNRWRFPSLSIHGIEGAYADSGFKTVIPGSVIGKFSIRLVPGQDAKKVEESVREALQRRFDEMKSGNELRITSTSAEAWLGNPRGELYQAGAAAVLKVYGVRPDLTREGCSIPVVGMLQKALGVDTMLLPLGASDDGSHSENEKFGRKNYLMGIHVLFMLMLEIERVDAEREGGRTRTKGALGRLKDIWYGLS